ncbi:MAG: mutA [Frankiales bacterium]|nr:mutA [Frankiales bacterium]
MTVSAQPLTLAAEFAAGNREAWRTLVAGVLAKSGVSAELDPEAALATPTYDGFDLAPLYTAEDLPPNLATGLPGQAPFIRGASSEGATKTGWDIRSRHEQADPKLLNRALLADLENGCTSVWLTVGAGGVAVADLAAALEGVYLDLAPIVLDAGPETAAAAAEFLRLAAERAVPAAELAGSLGADPVGDYARTGAEPDLTGLSALFATVADSPALRVVTVDGTVYNDAGGSDSDEIAVATAVAVEYLRTLTDAGVALTDALAGIEFRFAVTADQFSSIGKLRAARQVWSRVAELSGAEQEHHGQRQHAVTSAAMLTKRDPWVNMLRTTIGCFAAAVGGAEAITVLPFDSALGVSDDFARRIARNTQSVLHDESSLARVIDPAGGSYYVEKFTQQLAEAAWDKFTAIERAGGALAALRSGHIPALLAETAKARASAIAHRTDAITGVSEFAFIAEEPVVRPERPGAATAAGSATAAPLPTLRYAEDFEALRDRSDAHLKATGARPRVFLAGLGPVGAHSGRMGFASNIFSAAGIVAVESTGPIESQVSQFAELAQAGPAIVCLCSSDRLYAEAAAEAAAAFVKAGAATVFLAGQPGARADSDAAAGISHYVYAGCDALAAAQVALTALEVA